MFLYILLILAFLDMFIQLPIISPYAQSLGASPFLIGLIVGMYSLTNMIGNVLAGRWVDKYGAKKVLFLGMAATAIILGLYLLVQTATQLAAVRFLHGLSGGLLVPSIFTLVSGLAKQDKQGKNMALSGAAVGIAAVIGPAIGGIMKAKLGEQAVFLLVAVLMATGALLVWLFLQDPRAKKDPATPSQPTAEPTPAGTSFTALLRNPATVQSYLGAFALMFTMGVLTYLLPLKADALDLQPQAAGLLLSTFGLVAILIFLLPVNRLFDRIPARQTMLAGIGTILVALVGLSLFEKSALLYATMGVYGVGFALLFPSMNKHLVEHVAPEDRGKAFGILYAVFSVGVVVGSFTIGVAATSTRDGFQLAALFLAVMGAFLYGLGRLRAR